MASVPLLRFSLCHSPPATSPATRQFTSTTNAALQPPLLLRPLRSISAFPTIRPLRLPSARRTTPISMSYNPTVAIDRLVSAVSYFLPFFNGLQYGRYLFAQYPKFAVLFEPILPLLSLYRSVPYASFVAFFALYLGVVRNPSFSRYVRFNAMQAVVLDVLLVIPVLLLRIFTPGRSGIGFKLMVMGHNALFTFVVFCFVYSLVSTILGRTPYLPFVADAAGRQLGG
ncbi:protein TIC 20-II, chloroplastic [Impatiens glandulifera]|uniref:protein TIC 20-II, chloroplastic n=1 Tax=Impatiens glandulifera TaxID=253017 RepID=UPI001FB0A68C|nr:protein TIC 20-II, chloroplastic [Impatiens glandulifera]